MIFEIAESPSSKDERKEIHEFCGTNVSTSKSLKNAQKSLDNYNLFDWLRVTVGTELENKRIVDVLQKLKENLS